MSTLSKALTAWLVIDWLRVNLGWPDIHWLATEKGRAGGSQCEEIVGQGL